MRIMGSVFGTFVIYNIKPIMKEVQEIYEVIMIKYDKLWETMKGKGITKYNLHKEYHISKSQISRLQHNQGVSMNTINTLCNILDCHIEDIATHYKD